MLKMTMEQALIWAYRDELPKAGLGGRLRGPRLATPGWVRAAETWAGRIDVSNEYGLMPDFGALHPPHRAAIALDALTHCLDDLVINERALTPLHAWQFNGDEAPYMLRAAIERALALRLEPSGRLRASPAEIIRRAALIGPPGGWEHEPLRVRPLMAADGRRKWFRRARTATAWDARGRVIAWGEAEIDGWDIRRRRPHPDAYEKYQLWPDPAPPMIARLDWCIWAAALEALDLMAQDAVFVFAAERVTLCDLGVEILPSSPPPPPWICEYSRADARNNKDFRQLECS